MVYPSGNEVKAGKNDAKGRYPVWVELVHAFIRKGTGERISERFD
jgi:hypothetical protein